MVVTKIMTTKQKKIAGRIPEATRSTTKTSRKAEAITFCIKPLTHYLTPGLIYKSVKFKPLSPREKKCSKILLLKTFGNVKKV